MNTPDTPDAPFDEPWQAQLFGLTVALNESGFFAWSDWSPTLGAQLAQGHAYWDAWLRALETILTDRGVAPPDELAALAEHWKRAAHATPHGTPIRLENAP